MPELPEVEIIRRGISRKIEGQKIITITRSNHKLRYPLPQNIASILKSQHIQSIKRRGKYILIITTNGALIIHLGMSGNLQVQNQQHTAGRHEHFRIICTHNLAIYYSDPRRFGAILWTTQDPLQHKLLKSLGPEPLDAKLTATYLYKRAQTKKCSIKQFLMDSHIIAGIGNIYASEVLFAAKIHPKQITNTLTLTNYQTILQKIRHILKLAIKHHGTTIRDHKDSNGKQGSFQNFLQVYGRAGKECFICQTKLVSITIAQRATVFCLRCQLLLHNGRHKK